MSHTAALCVNICASESRSCDIFVGYTFDNFWSGYKHLADVVDHKDKVCDSRAVYSPPGTVSGNDRNLRNITGSHRIVIENLTITGKGVYTFLNTGSARIVNTDDRTAVLILKASSRFVMLEPISRKESSSSRRQIRSNACNLPSLCCFSMLYMFISPFFVFIRCINSQI